MNFIKKPLLKLYYFYWNIHDNLRAKKNAKFLSTYSRTNKPIVFYLGEPLHNNLGDMAQFYCIDKWIQENFKNYDYLRFNAYDIVNKKANFIEVLKKIVQPQDIIVFQSGYTTTDLGGVHDEMHKLIFDNLSNPNVLMMPQTIFFKDDQRKKEASISYTKDKNLLFLARDEVSYQMAQTMFEGVHIRLYPDIVTTLIGTYSSTKEREGVYLCCRNDNEKFYSDQEIQKLIDNLRTHTKVDVGDTTIKMSPRYMKQNIELVLKEQFDFFASHKVVITDRYHGTIFSLISNTPVIVIKTNDHKVVTGVDWFKGIYDNVYFAENLDIALEIANGLLNQEIQMLNKPYFKEEYYDKLANSFFDDIKYRS